MAEPIEVRLDPDVVAEYERSPQFSDLLMEQAQRGADYWEDHARKRTGHMSQSAYPEVLRDGSGLYAQVTIDTRVGDGGSDDNYAWYQEHGTRYIEGMHITADVLRAMEVE